MARSRVCARTRSPISAPICRRFRRPSRPISTRRCCRGNTTFRTSIVKWTRFTPTPRRSTPIAAPAGRKPASWSNASSEVAARETGRDPAEFRRMNFIKSFPHQTPVIMTYDAGDLRRRARQGARPCRLQGRRPAQGGFGRQGQAARRRLFRLYRGLRHRSVGGGRLARRRRGTLGVGGSEGQPDRHRRGPDRLP